MSEGLRDPIALHRRNNAALTAHDVIVPAYPGSGHAFLGNVLLELGLNYSDPYTEVFGSSGQSVPLEELEDYRRRLAATATADTAASRSASDRFVKTHLYPHDFLTPLRGVVLLIRDPRDAIYSYYRWRLIFSEEGEHGSFEEFLDRPGVNGVPPCVDWTRFAESWLSVQGSVKDFVILRFEDLKRDGIEALEPLLHTFAAHVDRLAVARAFEASSFDAMRSHEDRVSDCGDHRRIMRRGKVEEWREWFRGLPAKRFDDPSLRKTACAFGYTEWPKEH